MIPNVGCAVRFTLRRSFARPPHSYLPKQPKSTSTPNSNGPSTARAAPESAAKTIPGPSWLWLEPLSQPFRAYGRAQSRRPLLTQFISTLTIYFLGDLSAQTIARPKRTDPETGEEEEWAYDPRRALNALVIGGINAIPSYKWFMWLSNNFNYASKALSISVKVLVNQIVFTPIFNSYFFGMQSVLAGATLPEVLERIRDCVPTSWYNSCKLWPAVTAFSFAVVPMEFRSVFAGVIAIFWQTYLSLLNQRAAEREAGEHEEAPLAAAGPAQASSAQMAQSRAAA